MIFGYALEQDGPNGGREPALPGVHWKTEKGAQKAADKYNAAALEDGWVANATVIQLDNHGDGYVFYTR